jgi:probable phosphoglycerate mutase
VNHLAGRKLHNRYFVMRHGESKPNASGVIISHPRSAIHPKHGLTDEGRRQAEAAARVCDLDEQTIIYSSDFSRALETAEIVREVIGAGPIHTTPLLRERFFGDLEGVAHDEYRHLWANDVSGAAHRKYNIEPPEHVMERTTQLVLKLEDAYQGKTILLVSHGDPMKILQAAFKNQPPSERDQNELANAEIRELVQL